MQIIVLAVVVLGIGMASTGVFVLLTHSGGPGDPVTRKGMLLDVVGVVSIVAGARLASAKDYRTKD